ncbi:MAG: dipeptidase [Verrucomicrobiales bacterium]
MIFDAHLDLALNAIEWNRDLTRPLGEIRAREAHLRDKPDRGRGTVCLPELRRGGIGLVVATQLARLEHNAYSPVFGWASQAQAWAMTQAQWAWYRAMEELGEMVQVRDRAGLEHQVALWNGSTESRPTASAHASPAKACPGQFNATRAQPRPAQNSLSRSTDAHHHAEGGIYPVWRDSVEPLLNDDVSGSTESCPTQTTEAPRPVGYILSLEGADSLISIKHLERAYEQGLRAVGPAHYGPGVYAQGTDASGGFNHRGRDLLREIERLGLILDVTHLSDDCFWEALELFTGSLWASHHNCRALVPAQRQLSDEMIKALVQRDAVIGVAFDAWMLVEGWTRGVTTSEQTGVSLRHVADHFDHICQVAGDARHVGIGSDLDGAFGKEQCPLDLESIADLEKLGVILGERGYGPSDIEGVLAENFLRFWREAWA